MIEYLYRDLLSAVRYLPYGLLFGIPVAAFFLLAMKKQKKKEVETLLSVVCFGFYLALILVITLLSREGGYSAGMDLELFSTWGINDRNNAYVVENVLLFMPYGFFACWAFKSIKGICSSAVLGAVTSLGIEYLQLATGRGFFQIDDILTNTLGTVIGLLVFKLFFVRKRQG